MVSGGAANLRRRVTRCVGLTKSEYVFAPLEGGLPSREPQILKSLILFVWSVRILAPKARMVSAPAPSADFIAVIFQGSKTGSAVLSFKQGSTLQRGPKKIDFFRFLFI